MDRLPSNRLGVPDNASDIDKLEKGRAIDKEVKHVAATTYCEKENRSEDSSKVYDRSISDAAETSVTSSEVGYDADSDVESGYGSDLDVKGGDTACSLSLQVIGDMADKVLSPDQDFHAALLLSGQGKTQKKQVNALCEQITERFFDGSEKSLIDLLDQIKTADSQNPKQPTPHSFLLRCAILQASEAVGAGIQSWQAFTHVIPPDAEGDAFWLWLEQPGSWIPEAQGAAAKYMEHSWVQALELAKKHPEQQVVVYKGGFGAGKTSHGKAIFGEHFSGSIAPDGAKKVVRKALPVSHATAHTQSSDMAFKLFDGLIKHPMGTIIYDSSLSSVTDLDALIEKSSKSAKPVRVVDITRDDQARALAVLARSVDGEDPRIPLSFIESGAERDRKQRPACMNAVLDSLAIEVKSEKSEQTKTVAHTYEFHCGNAEGADRQLVCTLKSGQPPIWNKKLTPSEIIVRLAGQGLKFNSNTGRFEPLFSKEQWQKKLRVALRQPVKILVKRLSDGEAKIRERCFSQRTLPVTKAPTLRTPANLYACLSQEIRSVISADAFIKSFDPLDFEEQQEVISQLVDAQKSGNSLSYMELPAVMAIELHKALRNTPDCWGQGG